MPAPEIVNVNLIHTRHGKWLVVTPEDESALATSEPYGYTRDVGKALVIDGRYYVLREGLDPGIGEWSEAVSEAEELAIDAEVSQLSPKMRKLAGFEHWVPYPERKARRALDDAEADLRAASENDRAAVEAKVEERRAALEAVKGVGT